MKSDKIFAAALLALAMTACGGAQETNTKTDGAAEAPAAEAAAPEAKTDQAAPAAAAPVGVKTLADDTQFRPNKKVDVVTVLDFNATWCVPCKKLTPAYEEAAKAFEGKVAFYSVDFEKLPQTAKAFEVTSVPTVFILSPDGNVQRFVGLGAFMEGASENATPADQTATITKNLKALIEKALN